MKALMLGLLEATTSHTGIKNTTAGVRLYPEVICWPRNTYQAKCRHVENAVVSK